MKHLVVLGAGTAGTTIVNKLHARLSRDEWAITVVDQDDRHPYQPGFLLLPFGVYRADELTEPRSSFMPEGVDFRIAAIDRVIPAEHRALLVDGTNLPYDALVIATGTSPRPDQTEGMLGAEWHRSIHEFYTLEGSEALAGALQHFERGRLVVHITEMPIKCPVAPLEFTFLADAYLRKRGIRDQVEITYVTPLDGAFTKPIAARMLGGMLDERHVHLEADFTIEHVDSVGKTIVSYDERVVPFDLLVTVPLNMGADYVQRSGLGDELNYVHVDKGTFQSATWPDIFAVGDAADLPTSKAGSTAHFASEIFVENFVELAAGRPMSKRFDGHANCFVESGDAHRLQLRHRAAPREGPDPGDRADDVAARDGNQPPRQDGVQVDLLEPAAARASVARADADEHGGQGTGGHRVTARIERREVCE
jgi:sulfide:quinone oxidoreductase